MSHQGSPAVRESETQMLKQQKTSRITSLLIKLHIEGTSSQKQVRHNGKQGRPKELVHFI